MKPTFLLVRHAPTTLNDPSTEAIRGHSDIPISGEGQEHVKQTAIFLKNSGMTIRRILSSPLQRAMMSAQIVADEVNAKITPSRELTPWDLGTLTGKKITEVAPKMDHFQHFPDLLVPMGESYRTFFDRWSEGLSKMQDYARQHLDEVVIGVVHSRNLLALPAILGRKSIGHVPVKGGPSPASVTRIWEDSEDHWKYETIFEQKL